MAVIHEGTGGRAAEPVGGAGDEYARHGWLEGSVLLRVFHGMLASHGDALRPRLLEGGLSQPAAQLGQGISSRWGSRHVGQPCQPVPAACSTASAAASERTARRGLPAGRPCRQPLRVVADARLVPGVAGDRQPTRRVLPRKPVSRAWLLSARS
jgi:hypothetical protein